MNSYETQSRKIGLIATVSIHAVLLLLFIFVVASSPADPVQMEFGVAVNYGTSDEGFGDKQNYNLPSNNPSNATQKAASQDEEKTQFTENKVVTNPQTQVEKVTEADKQLTSDDKDSPPIVTQTVKETPKEIVKETRETVNPNPAPQPVNATTVITKGSTGGTEDGNSKNGGGNNNGNKEGTVGDMGKTNGDINSDALLGNGGTGGGASLDMAGWVWDEKPEVNDKSSETGKIIFEIKIDDDGEVISVKNIYSTVSRSVTNLYEKAVYDLTFSTTSDTGIKSAVTTGKIVFVIKSR
jgi:outer membrane biosynthesis protein TonB